MMVSACGARNLVSRVVPPSSDTATPAPTTTPPSPTAAPRPTPGAPSASPSPVATTAALNRATPAPLTAAQFKEAPGLTDLVKANKLPPVEQRLPAKPYVVPHAWLTPGNYGGQLQLVCADNTDWGTA